MKHVITVTGQQLELFRPLLPHQPLQNHQAVFGCLEEGKPTACGVVDICGQARSLSWLYVPKPLRGQGWGGTLLDGICQAVLPDSGQLELCYDPEAPWAWRMDALVARRGGRLRLEELPCFTVTADQLRAAPLMRGVEPAGYRAAGVRPLNDVTSPQLHELKLRCERTGVFSVSRADFTRADPQRSMVMVHENRLVGLSLVRSLDGEGRLNLDLLYMDKGFAPRGLGLLRMTASAMLVHPEDLVQLRFLCVGEAGLELGSKLLGPEYRSTTQLTSGVISQKLYRPGTRSQQ